MLRTCKLMPVSTLSYVCQFVHIRNGNQMILTFSRLLPLKMHNYVGCLGSYLTFCFHIIHLIILIHFGIRCDKIRFKMRFKIGKIRNFWRTLWKILTSFRTWLSWTVNSDFDCLCVGSHLRWTARYRYCYGETFTCMKKKRIIEF